MLFRSPCTPLQFIPCTTPCSIYTLHYSLHYIYPALLAAYTLHYSLHSLQYIPCTIPCRIYILHSLQYIPSTTKFLPTPTLGHRALLTQTQCNPYHHQDTISVDSTLLYNHPPTLHNTTSRIISQLQKLIRIHMIIFFIRKNNKPTTSIGQHSRRKWFSEEKETSLLGKNKNKSMIIHKKQRWPQATKLTTTNKNYNSQQG